MVNDFTNSLEQKTALTAAQIDLKENEFKNFNIVDKELVWEKMGALFKENPKLDADYRLSYFLWYTDFTWKMFNNREHDLVVSMCLARQIPMAILLDFDVWRNIMWYLGLRTIERPDMESLYIRMKNAFLESEAYVGKWNGEAVTVKDLVKEIVAMNTRNDSMEQAEFKSKLLQVLFPQNDSIFEKYISTEQDLAVERFIDLTHFFLGVDKDHIWYVVETFLHPEKYENVVLGEVPTPSAPAEQPPVSAVPTPKPTPTPQLAPVAKPAAPVKPDPQQIKSQIESQFKKDAEGNFEDIEGVMAKLNELAEKNNDSKIAEMIYFDESSGKFLWKLS